MTARPRRRRGFPWPVWVVVLVAGWLVIGFVRAPRAAEDWLAASEGRAGKTATGLATEVAVPAVPPFWLVNVSGDVTEAGGSAPVYRSYQLVLIEPITGFALVVGQG